jgi:hypothetical protein
MMIRCIAVPRRLEATVANLPRDVADLYLAPVVLAIDERIEELATLDANELRQRVGVEVDGRDWSREQRALGLLQTVCHFIDCRGWTLSWDERGIRLTSNEHTCVLGIPATFIGYVAGVSG